jgi:hypothetical protein
MLKKSFTVLVIAAVLSLTSFCAGVIPGDVNGDGKVNDKDAYYLVYHDLFPKDHPLNQDCDFNGDGEVGTGDAILMLYNTFGVENDLEGTTIYSGNSGEYITLTASCTEADVGEIIDFTVSANKDVYVSSIYVELTFSECFEYVSKECMLAGSYFMGQPSINKIVIGRDSDTDFSGDILSFSLKVLSVPDKEQKVSIRVIGNNSDNDSQEVFDETVVETLWETKITPVMLSEIKILDSSYNELESIPPSSFVAQVSAENVSHDGYFTVMFSYYDKDGKLLGVRYMYSNPDIGKTTDFGTSITNTDGNVAKVTAMVFDTLNSVKPLAEKQERVINAPTEQ